MHADYIRPSGGKTSPGYLTIMPPSKVCPQCETIVPLRLKVCKSCKHVFRAKREAEHNLPDKAMKHMESYNTWLYISTLWVNG